MTPKNEKEIVRIDLNQTQKDQLKAKVGRDAEAIELTVEELEEEESRRAQHSNENAVAG